MTPKEKAWEIFDHFYDLLYSSAEFDDEKENPIFKNAAIITVKEIIKEIKEDNERLKYWENVKMELLDL